MSGVAILRTRLDPSLCARLVDQARSWPASPRPRPIGSVGAIRFDASAPIAPRYDFEETQIIQSDAAQALMADTSLMRLAQDYLGTAPVNDLVALWWSACTGDEPSSEAAQLFHFDRDRLAFLKVFVYLTDVTPETGPHVYVLGSHRRKPPHFFRDRRFSDDEVRQAYDGQVRELLGPPGTVLLVDTAGLHKGRPVQRGERLILQLEYANSLFGQTYGTPHLPTRPLPVLPHAVERFPSVFRRFLPAVQLPGDAT